MLVFDTFYGGMLLGAVLWIAFIIGWAFISIFKEDSLPFESDGHK
jgi:hypothetical protein